MANDLPYRCVQCMKWGNRANDELELVGEQGQQQYVCADREACEKRVKQMAAPPEKAGAESRPPVKVEPVQVSEGQLRALELVASLESPDVDPCLADATCARDVARCYIGHRVTFTTGVTMAMTNQGPIAIPTTVQGTLLAVFDDCYLLMIPNGRLTALMKTAFQSIDFP